MTIACWGSVGGILWAAGLGITDPRYWGVMILVSIIAALSRQEGRIQGIYTVMDMPAAEYSRYKAAWSRAEQHNRDPPTL